MKRVLLESLLAGALAFALVRLPLDFLMFGGDGGASLAATLSWAAAGAMFLTMLIGAPLMRHAIRSWRAQDAWRYADVSRAPATSTALWRPRANPYALAARSRPAARRARKIAVERVRRAAPARRGR